MDFPSSHDLESYNPERPEMDHSGSEGNFEEFKSYRLQPQTSSHWQLKPSVDPDSSLPSFHWTKRKPRIHHI